MSPQTLTDDSPPPAEPAPPTPAETAPEASRPRRTVREMQIALEAARSLAAASPQTSTTAEQGRAGLESEERGGADRSHAAPGHDALEGNSPVTPPIVAPAPAPTPDATTASSPPEPWVPDHDGPVSLTGVAAPRRSVRRTVAQPDKAARRPTPKRQPTRPGKSLTPPPETAARAAASPPLILAVPACGGAGATTVAVLLAAGLAPAAGAALLAPGDNRGAAAARSGAEGGNTDALSQWATRPAGALSIDTPGVAVAYAGQTPFLVAGARRGLDDHALSVETATRLIDAARAATRTALVVDWATASLPIALGSAHTHVIVVAPTTSPGLLAAEYTVQQLEHTQLAHASLSLITVDVRGRAARRAGRAALARLRALNLPTAAVPFDPALADEPAVHWPSLRPSTRTAVFAGLTQLLQREDTP